MGKLLGADGQPISKTLEPTRRSRRLDSRVMMGVASLFFTALGATISNLSEITSFVYGPRADVRIDAIQQPEGTFRPRLIIVIRNKGQKSDTITAAKVRVTRVVWTDRTAQVQAAPIPMSASYGVGVTFARTEEPFESESVNVRHVLEADKADAFALFFTKVVPFREATPVACECQLVLKCTDSGILTSRPFVMALLQPLEIERLTLPPDEAHKLASRIESLKGERLKLARVIERRLRQPRAAADQPRKQQNRPMP